ncbi:MAG: branched-chain amino acid ABC transporter permease [Nocardioides sp.]
MNVLQTLVLGVVLGGVYALMAAGLTLVYGVMRIINLAHGALLIASAYAAFFLNRHLGLDPIVSLVLTGPGMFVAGALLYRLLFTRLEGDDRYSERTVLLTFGLALVIEGLLGYFFTGIFRSTNPAYAVGRVEIGDLFIPRGQLYAAIVSVVLLTFLAAFLALSRTGHAITALSQNRRAAQTVGVNVLRVSSIAFGVGLALAGAAGSLMSYLYTFYPGQHWQWIALLMSLIVLGGMGSIKGAVVAAVILAVAAAFVSEQFGAVWTPMTFYLALFGILLARPQGLFGVKGTI